MVMNKTIGTVTDNINDWILKQRLQAAVDEFHVINRVTASARKTMDKIESSAKSIFFGEKVGVGLVAEKIGEAYHIKNKKKANWACK